jgi:alginate O-acetyltransferase complex protein AlgI
MVFSSIIFLFFFLPVVLTAYYAMPRQLRNLLLLGASLLFYAWGELGYVLLMVVSIMGNYLLGLLLERSGTNRRRKVALASAVVLNLALLGSFKYANFIVDNLAVALGWLGVGAIELAPVHLPIGISFFTFLALSYVADVYRGESAVQRSPIKLAMYISLFPQLIAGPIVRYNQIVAQLTRRTHDLARIHRGVQRFIIGLAKNIPVIEPGQLYDQAESAPEKL